MDVPIWQKSIPFLLFYFAPVFIGGYRRMQGKEKSWPAWGLFLIIFFTGWSIIGWLFALRMAFRDKDLAPAAMGGGGGGGGGYTPPPTPSDTTQPPSPCMQCGGNGTLTCPSCYGRGSWWESSTTAEGTGSPAHCSYCVSSGKVTCGSCAGTGKARW
jgi:hypothetical protein